MKEIKNDLINLLIGILMMTGAATWIVVINGFINVIVG